MQSTFTFLLAVAAPLVSAQGWSLAAYDEGVECGGDGWYVADSVGGEWQCSDLYGKNPDGEYPSASTNFTSIFWSGAEDCGAYPGGGCGNYVSDLVWYSDAGCTSEVQSFHEYDCGGALDPNALYFKVVNV